VPIRTRGLSRGLAAALIGMIALASLGADGGIALASTRPAPHSAVLTAAGPGNGYISTFYVQSVSPSTPFAVSHLRLPAGKFLVSMTGEGVAFTNATASLTCSFSPTSKGYVPYAVHLDGSPKTIGAVAAVDLPSGGTVTLSCSAGQPAGKFVLVRGALTAVHVAALTG
jgi:hypothetical protein